MFCEPDASRWPEMIRLWKTAFGDDDAFIAPFFRRMGNGLRARVCIVDGHVAAAAYLLDASLDADGVRTPMWYEYALATQPALRGRGLMTALLADVRAAAAAAGVPYTALRPASEKLADYYARRGYRPYFRSRVVPMTRAELGKLENSVAAQNPYDPEQAWERALARTAGSAHWSQSAIAFALQAAAVGGDHVYAGSAGFAVWAESGGEAEVKLWAPQTNASALARELLRSPCSRFWIRVPVHSPDFPDGDAGVIDGMLRSTDGRPLPDSADGFLGMEID